MDLWSLFIENIFGGFWMSIVGLIAVMGIILMLGSVGFPTVIIFSMFFILAMAIGYGHPIITIPIVIIILATFTFEIIGFIDKGGGQ